MHEYDLVLAPIITLSCISIGLVVFFNDRKSVPSKVTAVIAVSIGFWILTAFLSDIKSLANYSLLFNRSIFVALTALMGGLVYLPLVFPFESKWAGYLKWPLIIFTLLFSVIIMSTSQVIRSVEFMDWGTNIIYGPFFTLFTSYAIGAIVVSLTKFIINLIKLPPKERTKIWLFFEGLFLLMLMMVVVHVVIRSIVGSDEYYRFGNYSAIVFVGFTAYAIVKHQLFNVKAIITEFSVSVMISAIIVQTIFSKGTTGLIINLILLLLTALGGYILIISVLSEIKRREELERLAEEKMKAYAQLNERSRNLVALQKFSNIVLDNNELKPMMQDIIDAIPKEVNHCFAALVALANPEKGVMSGLAISRVTGIERIKTLLNKDITDFSIKLDGQENLMMQAYHEQAIQRGNNLADFLAPPLNAPLAREIQHDANIHGTLAVPLSAGKEHFGVLLYGMKVPMETIAPEEISMMTAIADEVSLAVQRAMAYEELKKANEYLKELDKMKDEFISVASHELNTPLAAIEGYLSMILDEHMGKLDKTAHEYLNRVYDSSKRLASLIADLLNVSRIEQGRIHLIYSHVKMEDLVKSVINELIVKANPKKIYLKFSKPKKAIPQTWLDNNRVREVLINLVGNAIKFTDKGGITIEAKADAKLITVSVTDTGAGIDPKEADRLFKKFSQLNREKNEMQGTGLGLYISKNLVELHGGKIWIESKGVGKGTKFTFTLPIVREKPSDPYEGEGSVLKQAIKQPDKPKDAGPTLPSSPYTLQN